MSNSSPSRPASGSKIVSPQGNFIMTVKDKDSIVGPMGMVLARKK